MEQSQPQWKVGQSMNNKVETTGHMDLNNVSNIEHLLTYHNHNYIVVQNLR